METLRVVELYSGIGGMHSALKESGIPAQVVAAIDINTTANQIYKHNFPDTPLWNKTIEGISLDDFNKLSFDMILMSPPCQPFTRIGLQGDIRDSRTKSFLYILDLLPRLCKLPRFILLENVKGFESSSARELLDSLCNLIHSLVCDSDRLNSISVIFFFFLCSTHPAACQPEEEMQHDHFLYKLETGTELQRKMKQNSVQSVRMVQDFLEPQMEVNLEHYLLPPKTLLRYALILDIVQPTCRRSTCFTKGYGRYVEGTGSVLQCCMETEMQSVFAGLDQCSEEEKLQRLSTLKLRYFTPREVANLMGFPQSFSFPEQITSKQQYKVLGNSLNVVVVSRLLQLLVS
uniref:tRNA (cytosine(38)-C(5))-methyltransferase n=1 Tax=Anabas testudineus TaxID=64144 RepID=A0A7N6AKH5_ANATE